MKIFYKNIAQKTEQALLKVAKTNALNNKRVELIYGVKLDSVVDEHEEANSETQRILGT